MLKLDVRVHRDSVMCGTRTVELPRDSSFDSVWDWIGSWGEDCQPAVRYVDDEGDEITVFNTPEWEECVRCAPGNVVHLSVSLTPPSDDPDIPDSWDGSDDDA